MKIVALIGLVFLSVVGHPQSTLNSYKYVLVPERFDFAKEDDPYGVNSMTKSLLELKGFVAYMVDEKLPPELAANKCIALRAEITARNTFFSTNFTLVLKDCQGNIIFKGKEGKSREKDLQPAYSEALKNAISSLDGEHYKYDSSATASVPVSVAPAAPVPTPAVAATPVQIAGVLYAQAISNGYQLVDNTPKKVMILLKTSLADYFIAEAGASNGIVFKKDGAWVFEYYKDSQLVSQKLEIKF